MITATYRRLILALLCLIVAEVAIGAAALADRRVA